MTNFGPHDVLELRGVEARSLDLLRALAMAGQQTLAGAIDQAVYAAGGDVHYPPSARTIANTQFEIALQRALPQVGLRTPRPLGPVDISSLELLREFMLATDTTLPQALSIVLTVAGIEIGATRRIGELRAGELHAALEHSLASAKGRIPR